MTVRTSSSSSVAKLRLAVGACVVSVLLVAAAAAAATLEYVERVTAGADPSARLPLVIAIHGLGSRPESFARVFEGLEVPVRLIVPRAPEPWARGFSWFSLEPRAHGDQAGFARVLAEAAGPIAELIGELSSARPTRGKAIVTGFSQGGMLSFVVAVLHGDVIKLAIPIGGLLPRKIPALKPAADAPAVRPRIVALHGAIDARVDVAAARSSIARLRDAGFDASIETYGGVGHSISAAMRSRLLGLIAESSRDADDDGGSARVPWLQSPACPDDPVLR